MQHEGRWRFATRTERDDVAARDDRSATTHDRYAYDRSATTHDRYAYGERDHRGVHLSRQQLCGRNRPRLPAGRPSPPGRHLRVARVQREVRQQLAHAVKPIANLRMTLTSV
jgi:hypothetical protein